MWKNLAIYALLMRMWDVTRLWKEYEDSSKACVCVRRVCVFGLCIVCVCTLCVCVWSVYCVCVVCVLCVCVTTTWPIILLGL